MFAEYWYRIVVGLHAECVTLADMAATKIKAAFVQPMLLMRPAQLADGPEWLYELKLDGYRTLGIRTGGKVQIRSRNKNDFSVRYPAIAAALG